MKHVLAAVGACAPLVLAGASCTRSGVDARMSRVSAGDAATFHPDTRAMNAPAPPGLDPALTQLVGEDDAKARMALEEALAALSAGSADDQAAEPTEEATPEPSKRAEALRLYAQGRVARLTNQAREAVTALQAAARLDPSSSSIWRELGDAQLAAGNRVFAAAAFARALAIDPDDERALEQTAAIAVERRDYALAAERSARLLALDLERIDPALPFITWSRFARSASALGYTRASAEAAMRAVDLPERFNAPTTRENELNALYRTRGDTIRDAADAMLRLGRFAEARHAYALASRLPTLAPSSLTPRRVYASMRLGDAAGAVSVVIEQFRAARGRPDETLFPLFSHVAEHTGPAGGGRSGAPALLKGIDEVEASLSVDEKRLAAGSLVRARASASPRKEAVALLRGRLASAPWDEDAMRTLLSRLRGDSEAVVVKECLGLIEASPLQERRHGTALARELSSRRARERWSEPNAGGSSERSPAAEREPPRRLADALDDAGVNPGPAATLLRARLLAADNEPLEALALLESTAWDGLPGAAAALARASLLAMLGRTIEADAVLRSVDLSDIRVRAAVGLALAQRGDDERALETLSPLISGADASGDGSLIDRAELLIAAAQVHGRRGEAERARDRFEAALDEDPLRDEAYIGLISLYAPNQPLADEAKLVESIRRLRDANPSSRSLRWLRAQESLSRGQFDLAERDLADLAEESPTQPEVVSTLTQLWLRTGSASKAESWLRLKSERYPDSSALAVALAQAVTEQGRYAEAEAMLTQRLEQTPGDAEISRALESLYREELKQPEKADELARKRLASAAQTPETLLEQADLAWRSQRLAEATAHLRVLMDRFPRVTFRPDQAARLTEYIVLSATTAIRESQFSRSYVDLVNRLVDAAPNVAAEAHAVRLILSNRSGYVGTPELLSALERAVKQWPRRAEEFVARAADAAWNRARTQQNVEFPKADAEAVAQTRERSLRLVESGSRLLAKVPASIILDWMDLALVAREGRSFVTALERAQADGVLDAVLESMLGAGNARAARPRALADSAYQLANLLSFLGEDGAAESMLRVALRHDPRHHPSANDLGYRLLVADRDIDEAARLIEIANEQEPDRASYVDSLGWARYKQGRIRDEIDPATNEVRKGAVSLLTRALELLAREQGEDARVSTPIIVDHLGDACWVAGDHEAAIRHWEMSAQDTEAILKTDDERAARAGEDDGRLGGMLRAELEGVLAGARMKLNAARAGQAPPVSKVHGPVR